MWVPCSSRQLPCVCGGRGAGIFKFKCWVKAIFAQCCIETCSFGAGQVMLLWDCADLRLGQLLWTVRLCRFQFGPSPVYSETVPISFWAKCCVQWDCADLSLGQQVLCTKRLSKEAGSKWSRHSLRPQKNINFVVRMPFSCMCTCTWIYLFSMILTIVLFLVGLRCRLLLRYACKGCELLAHQTNNCLFRM